MKYFLLLLLILGIFYLNRSYAYFYNYFDEHFLAAPVWSPQTKEERAKFIALGDSLLDGVGASSEKASFGYLLHQYLDPNNEMNLINLAVSGAVVDDVLVRQLPRALQQNPKNVVLLIGTNNVHDGTSLGEFESDYREVVDELTSKTSAKITLITIPYLGSDKILLPPWNVYLDLKIRRYNRVIENLATEKNLELIDLYHLTHDKFAKSSDLYSSDQFHPSDKGYELWVELIEESRDAN